MNLYEIMLEHYAPKDSEQGIYTYLIAESDETVFDWVAAEHTLKDGRVLYNCYRGTEEDGESYELYDSNYDVIGEETFKEKMVRLKGDMNDDDVELTDLYYGKTLIGWKRIKEGITKDEIYTLQQTGISIEVA